MALTARTPISTLLEPAFVRLEIEATRRTAAINEVAQLLAQHPQMANFQGFYEELLARERVEPTCLGNGIACPHARTDCIKGIVLAVGRSTKGVLFESANQTVNLMFVIGTPKKMVSEYLGLVGSLARVLKEGQVRQELLNAASAEEFIAVIRRAEGL